MAIFTGAGVAIITPMKADGQIHYDKMGELLDYQPMLLLYVEQQVKLQR